MSVSKARVTKLKRELKTLERQEAAANRNIKKLRFKSGMTTGQKRRLKGWVRKRQSLTNKICKKTMALAA